MTNETTGAIGPLRLKLRHFLGGNRKQYGIAQTLTIISLVTVALLDGILSVRNNFALDACIIMGIVALQVVAIVQLPKNENRFLNAQNIFLVSAIAMIGCTILSGHSTGRCFYYFPAATVF